MSDELDAVAIIADAPKEVVDEWIHDLVDELLDDKLMEVFTEGMRELIKSGAMPVDSPDDMLMMLSFMDHADKQSEKTAIGMYVCIAVASGLFEVVIKLHDLNSEEARLRDIQKKIEKGMRIYKSGRTRRENRGKDTDTAAHAYRELDDKCVPRITLKKIADHLVATNQKMALKSEKRNTPTTWFKRLDRIGKAAIKARADEILRDHD